jgi:nucleotide-binding universal stress UspA family protein
MYEKILVPLDGSELAEVALPYAEELASRLKTEVALLQVVPRAYHVYDASMRQLPKFHTLMKGWGE